MYVVFAAAFILLLYYLQLNIYQKYWNRDLKVEARFGTSDAFEGEEASLTETISNEKILPLPVVKVKLQLSRELLFHDLENAIVSDFFYRTDIYSILPYQKVTRNMKFRCEKRGYYTFMNVDVVAANLFLTKEYVSSYDSPSYLYVFPKLYNPGLMEPVLNRINGETLTKRNLMEDPFELRGIREYQPYDGMKNINWKASAKSEELMVNMHDYTSHRTIRIFINVDKPSVATKEEILELCISMAAANASDTARNGVPMSLYSNGRDILTDEAVMVDEGTGENYLRSVNRNLARIDLSKKTDSFEKMYEEYFADGDKDSYDVFYSANYKDEFQEMLQKLSEAKKDYCWVCPMPHDETPAIREDILKHFIRINAEEAIYEKSLS